DWAAGMSSSSGRARPHPATMASAASTADSESPKESGARSTRMRSHPTEKYPEAVSLLGRKKDTTDEDDVVVQSADELTSPGKTTAPKGRPTPKRDAKRRPVAPAPMNSAEARRRRKKNKLSRSERREFTAAQRESMSDRRERMMAGEEG